MKHWLLVAALLTVMTNSAPKLVLASESRKSCVASKVHEKVVEVRSVIGQFKRIEDLPLPDDLIQQIRKHPIRKWMQQKYGNNKLVAFDGTTFLFGHSGETVQAHFILKVLKEVFDNVEVKTKWDMNLRELWALGFAKEIKSGYLASTQMREKMDDPGFLERPPAEKDPGYPVFNVSVVDIAEAIPDKRNFVPGQFARSLDMPYLKPANGTSGAIDHHATRSLFGIPEGSRVVSFYGNREIQTEALNLIVTALDPAIVFASHSFESNSNLLREHIGTWAQGKGYEVMLVSELKEGDLRSIGLKKVVVLNDTRGFMPYFHAAADLTVIHGAVNMFESLSVGTPTVVYVTPRELQREGKPIYHRETFEGMLAVALRTGGARHIAAVEEAPAILRESLNIGRTFTRPYLVRGPDGRTPVDRMLDHLKEIMEAQGL